MEPSQGEATARPHCNARAERRRSEAPRIGLRALSPGDRRSSTSPRATCPFDPGYDPDGRIAPRQSGHLIATLKISMACWMVADEGATRRKIAAAAGRDSHCRGGGPFETAVAQGALPSYLDLCTEVGLTRIECGEGFTD